MRKFLLSLIAIVALCSVAVAADYPNTPNYVGQRTPGVVIETGTGAPPGTTAGTPVTTANPLPVTVIAGGGGTQNVNILSVDPAVTFNMTGSVVASGTLGSTIADGADTTLGSKADAKSTATDTTAITIMQVLKEISAMEQAPASRAVTNAGTFATQAQPTPVTSGGLSVCYLQAANSSNATNCKNGAGQVYHIQVGNNSTNIAYLRLYNLSAAPTCTSATGFVTEYVVPAPSSGGGGFIKDISAGIAFSTGIGFCFSGAIGNTDNTSVAASAYTIEIDYK